MSCAYFEIWFGLLSHQLDFSEERITLYIQVSCFLPPMHYLLSTFDLAHTLSQRPSEGNYSTSHLCFLAPLLSPLLEPGAKKNIRPHSMNLRMYCSHDTLSSLVWLLIVDWSITTCSILCQYISFSSSSFFLIRFKGRFDISVCCLQEHRVWITYTSTCPQCYYTSIWYFVSLHSLHSS